MSLKFEISVTTSKDLTQQLTKQLQLLARREIAVGVPKNAGTHKEGDPILTIAAAHEFGATIKVTPKMRGYLAAVKGIHLKKSTINIVIPRRSFLISTFEENRTKYERDLIDRLTQAFEAGAGVEYVLHSIAQEIESDVKAKFDTNNWKPLSDATKLNRKSGSDTPLNDTGELRRSIRGVVRSSK